MNSFSLIRINENVSCLIHAESSLDGKKNTILKKEGRKEKPEKKVG